MATVRGILAAMLGASALALGGYAALESSFSRPTDGSTLIVDHRRPAAAMHEANEDSFAGRHVPSMQELAGISARPLFSPSRRPPEPVPVREPVAVSVPPPKVELGQFRLIGVVIENDTPLALLREVRGNALIRASLGERIEEWTVETIEPTSVTLRQRDVVDTVMLSDNESPAGVKNRPRAAQPPQAAAPGKPAPAVRGGAGAPRIAKPPARRDAAAPPPAPRRGVARPPGS